jgi:hypothetical protein
MTPSGLGEIRLGEDEATALLGSPGAREQPPAGEPSPVEADEAAWQREREQRKRSGRDQ